VKSSSITIDNAVKLSNLSGISQMAIGFIFIAVATSLPELSIGIISSLQGNGILSFGNLIGANISNLTLVLGAIALVGFNLGRIYSVQIEQSIIITTAIAIFLIVLGRSDFVFGIFCLAVFYLFSSYIAKVAVEVEVKGLKSIEIIKAIFKLLLSISLVIISAYIITNSSIALADSLGIAESVVGATILAIGTTLPELSVSLAAVRKRNISLAVGNIVGSIVTNLTLIFGIVSVINPIALGHDVTTALYSLIAVNLIFLFLAYRMKFGTREGMFLLSVFILYLIILLSGAA
jgi:cation:H+ antiporter